jgi:DNA-directed RNA polymerase II subunit RPB2
VGAGIPGGECPLGDNIYVNGVWIGVHRDAANLVKTLKRLRRGDDISTEVSVIRDIREREMRVYTDAG